MEKKTDGQRIEEALATLKSMRDEFVGVIAELSGNGEREEELATEKLECVIGELEGVARELRAGDIKSALSGVQDAINLCKVG